MIKVDGTGRTTLRNRKFLRKFTPYQTQAQPASLPSMKQDLTQATKKPSSRSDDDDQSEIPVSSAKHDNSNIPKPPTKATLSPQKPVLSPQQPVIHPAPQWITPQPTAQNATPGLTTPSTVPTQNRGQPDNRYTPKITRNISPQGRQLRRSSRPTKLVDRLGYAQTQLPGRGDNAS